MPDAFPQQQVGETPGGFPVGDPVSEERRELGRLLQEAARLLEDTDLSGANETLKEAGKALAFREGTDR